jgi:2-polyprenyl-6-methoxyphenol hydroxylase-like FAD-dependent oxidoreductase
MNKVGNNAVVLGASMGGLLAARVLADFYEKITLVERDELTFDPAQRRGVPQGRHAHGFLSSGSEVLDELFPGFLDDLAAAGATLVDGDPSLALLRFGGHDLKRPETLAEPLTSYLATRPFLETHVRRRLWAMGNVTILDGHDVVEMIAPDPSRVGGARVFNRVTGEERVLDADLVVDATGRAARTPAFLESVGYERPEEDRIAVQLSYSSWLLRIPAGTVREKMFLVGAEPNRPTGGALFACENDTWMLTLAGMAGHEPPTDWSEAATYAEEFAPSPMLAAIAAAEPIGDVCTYRYPASCRRRYDRMRRFPAGLLVFGDAICSFNPLYGQGMSVAALEAIVLRDCLLHGEQDLSRRFFRASAKLIDVVWQMAAGADLTLPQVDGRRTLSIRLSNWYTERVLRAAETDTAVTEVFFRVMNLVDPPTRLLRPSFVARIVAANRSFSQRNPQQQAEESIVA